MRSRRWRTMVALSAGVMVLAGSVAQAQDSTERAERAAAEILEARDRANAAAQALFDAESQLDVLQVEIGVTERRLAELETEVTELRSVLTAVAVRRFVGSGVELMPLLSDVGEFTDRAGSDVLYAAAVGTAVADEDDFGAAIEQAEHEREQLAEQLDAAARLREDYARLHRDAEEQIVRLTEIEQQRRADEAVQRELERLRREELEREAAEAAAAAEVAAQEAAAQQRALEVEQADQDEQPDQDDAADPTTDAEPIDPPDASDDEDEDDDQQPSTAPPPAPEPIAPPPPPPAPDTSGIVCPVAGPAAYADTWGAPRSGGRRHQGVDMMAARGTPLVAVEAGSVQMKTNPLGGNSIWLAGAGGTRYYYAHLSAWEGGSRAVSRGEVIGYVGATGNAVSDHLHFEVHPNGTAVNPYPYVRAVC